MKRGSPLSWLTKSACVLVAHSPELLLAAPYHERFVIVGEALLLLLVACSSGAAWAVFMTMFGSLPVGIACGLFAMAFILLLDRAIGSADWALSGILRKPGLRHDWLRIGLRSVITITLSFATSTGAIMAMDHTAIVHQVEADRLKKNKEINAYFEDQKAALRKQKLGSAFTDTVRLKAIIDETTPLLDAARKAQADAASKQVIAATEARREKNGEPGYKRGAGPLYRDALRKEQEADATLAHANAEVAIYEPRLNTVLPKFDAVNMRLQEGEDSIKDELATIEKQKQLRLVPEGYDAFMGYRALQQIYRSPEDGEAAMFFSWVMMGVLMTVELSYIGVRLIFSPASISHATLIKNVKLEAETINAEYELKSHNIRTELAWEIGPRPERPDFRIVSKA